jgi:hypothetical protein
LQREESLKDLIEKKNRMSILQNELVQMIQKIEEQSRDYQVELYEGKRDVFATDLGLGLPVWGEQEDPLNVKSTKNLKLEKKEDMPGKIQNAKGQEIYL